MSDHKKLLYKKHDQFDVAEGELRTLLKYEIKTLIEELKLPDAQDLHILGLVHYHTSVDIHDIEKAHDYFLSALKKNQDYYMARLYSAHCFHDINKYGLALEEYLKVDDEKLRSEFALWRFVKLQEQIGFCYFKLGEKCKASSYFNSVLEFYRKENFDELVDPVEIYECLKPSNPIFRELKGIERAYYDN